MRSKHPLALLLGLALTLPAVPAEAVPPFIRHEGLFLDEDGLPRLGDTQVQFSLWDAPTDGELLWRETRDISLTDGYYSVAFGELESLERVFDEEVTYLGISVDGEPEYDPRQRMGSVPYALIADNVTVYGVHVAGGSIPAPIVDITSKTGGAVFSPGDVEGLAYVFQRIDEMQETRIEKTSSEAIDDYAPWALAAIGLLAAALLASFGLRYTPW